MEALCIDSVITYSQMVNLLSIPELRGALQWSNYPLKMACDGDNLNACYANSVLQLIIHLGWIIHQLNVLGNRRASSKMLRFLTDDFAPAFTIC
jgi:hypothetical protein